MEKTNRREMDETIAKVIIASGEDILTSEKAGALFGISASAMRKRAQKGNAPAHKLGKKLYFFRSELIHMITQK